tara:strand:+ start:108 stop:614 length:507 start_codon:yes stop_codon:yes gene_type:complete
MIRNLNNLKPKINPNAYVNESAYVVGEVEIDEFSSVWPGAVIRADSGKISIGKRSNIQDNSAVHSDNGSIIGDDVTIGHGVVIHSKKIGNGTLIGNGAVLNDEVTIGSNCIVAAGSVVIEGTDIPDNSIVRGIPGKAIGRILDKHKELIKRAGGFYVERSKIYKEAGL